jgi:spore coat protein A, manganese oxidase
MTDLSRRRFLQYSLGGSAGAAVTLAPSAALRGAGAPNSSSAVGPGLEKFVQPLPLPGRGLVVAAPTATDRYSFVQRQIERRLHPSLPRTPLWAYDDGSGLAGQTGSFGMVIAATSGRPLTVDFTHDLPPTYPAWIPVDTRLTPGHTSEVRVMTHLHGGFVAADSDGNPAATPRGFGRGETQRVHYPNQAPQNAATLLWFHDHGLGTTRLNVFAGLAAAYVLRDRYDTGEEPNPIGIPGGAYEIPLVIQDRRFGPDGTFFYPTSDIDDVVWIGEYFGDVMLVNGLVWPYLEVEPRLYRFRILNGCNARILDLGLGGPRMWQIGAEGGMWDRPLPVRALVLAPAERADVIVDFTGLAGQTVELRNRGPRAPVSTPAPPLASVLQIRVGRNVRQPGPNSVPAVLKGGRAAVVAGVPVRRRFITLNEIGAETAGWYLNVDGSRFGEGAPHRPRAGTVEDWVYVNLTGDTHPMHAHLFTHQVIGRTPFDVAAYVDAFGDGDGDVPGGHDPTPFATGPMQPPAPEERGFKDTVKANPGYFTTIRGRFDLPAGVEAPQRYVHHCHIVEHEDNDMMETFVVS